MNTTTRMTPEFGLIVVGDEILSGKRADQHLPKVVELLAARGLMLAHADYVGDDAPRITATLARAFASGAVVFCCGGIGATPDDHTRQCAARALGRELLLHPEAEALIRARTQELARAQGLPQGAGSAAGAGTGDGPASAHRLNMGRFPAGARIIPNPYNKIPGFSCMDAGPGAGADGVGVHFVPGFPVMAWPMIEWVLEHYCAACFHRAPQAEQSVIVFGAMEAALTPLMERVGQLHPQVKVFSLPSVAHPQYGSHIELGVKGPAAAVEPAWQALKTALHEFGAACGPELVRRL